MRNLEEVNNDIEILKEICSNEHIDLVHKIIELCNRKYYEFPFFRTDENKKIILFWRKRNMDFEVSISESRNVSYYLEIRGYDNNIKHIDQITNSNQKSVSIILNRYFKVR